LRPSRLDRPTENPWHRAVKHAFSRRRHRHFRLSQTARWPQGTV